MGSQWCINELVKLGQPCRVLELGFKSDDSPEPRKIFVRLWQDGGVELCGQESPTTSQYSMNVRRAA